MNNNGSNNGSATHEQTQVVTGQGACGKSV